MKEEKLKRLLEKYYSGETTDDDEKQLKDFFSDRKKADDFDPDRALFSALADLDKIPEPSAEYESRILQAVTRSDRQKSMNIFSRHYVSLIGVAAAFLLLVGSYFLFIYKAEPKDTFSDPQIAYAETMKILKEVSVKLNKGKDELKPLTRMSNATKLGLETLDRSADVITTNLDILEPFSQLSDIDANN
jgi:hypothetical protein